MRRRVHRSTVRVPTPPQPPERPIPPKRPERPMPPQPPEIPPGPEERGATEVIAAGAAVVAALTAAIQVGGQIKDKITKN
jgi:hypothetical protein